MRVTRCATVAELNELVSETIIKELDKKQHTLFCTATGNSPTGIYQLLAEKKNRIDTSKLSLIKLDEWYNLPMEHPATCEYYLRRHFLEPLGISSYTAFDSKAPDPGAECSRINQYLDEHGPIDLCLLGLGQNGHIAFNEPADFLQPRAHLAPLSETSLTHTMIQNSGADVKCGFTLGMADILQSRKILLPVFGQNKRAIMQRLMEGKISSQLPASFLWLHPDAECFYCENDS